MTIMKKILLLTVLFLMGLNTMTRADDYIGLMNQMFSCNSVYSEETMRQSIQSGPNPIPYTGSVSFDGPKRRVVMKNLNVIMDGISFLYNYLSDSLVLEIHGSCRVQLASPTPAIMSNSNLRIVCIDGGSFKFVYGGSLAATTGVISMDKNSSLIFEDGSFIFEKPSPTAITFKGDYEPSTPPGPVSSQFTISKIAPKSLVFKNCSVSLDAVSYSVVGLKGYIGFLDCDITSPESYTIDSNGYLVEGDGTTPVSKLTISPCVHFDAGGLWYRGKDDGTVSVTFQNPFAPRYSSLGSSLTVPSSVRHKNKTYSVSEVGVNAFSGCSSLQSVSLPSSIKSIGSFGFYQCTNLKSMTLPGKLESISTGAFLSCTGMTTLTIPASVNDIGNMAFRNCGNLAKIYSHIVDPTKVNYTKPAMIFQGVNKSTCILYVPKGKIWIYSETDPWSDFTRFSEIQAAGGDLNGDGKVNVSDVTVLINMILGIVPMNQSVADVNGDGKVNVSDVSALINIILA